MKRKNNQTEFVLNLVGKKRKSPIIPILVVVIVIILYFLPGRNDFITNIYGKEFPLITIDILLISLIILGVLTLCLYFYNNINSNPAVAKIQDLFERENINTNFGREHIIQRLREIADINSISSQEDKQIARNILTLLSEFN